MSETASMSESTPTTRARDIYDLVRARRSIRRFRPEPVPRERLDRILDAATYAPSGKNEQNWRFFVLTGARRDAYLAHSQRAWEKVRETLERRLKPSLYQFTERFFYTLGDAPVLIFAFSEPNPEENRQTSIGSVYMAVENLLLAAVHEGLGTCALGSPLEVEEAVREIVGKELVASMDLVCGIAVGVPDHSPPAARRRAGVVTWL